MGIEWFSAAILACRGALWAVLIVVAAFAVLYALVPSFEVWVNVNVLYAAYARSRRGVWMNDERYWALARRAGCEELGGAGAPMHRQKRGKLNSRRLPKKLSLRVTDETVPDLIPL
jgi:hypothetical protein